MGIIQIIHTKRYQLFFENRSIFPAFIGAWQNSDPRFFPAFKQFKPAGTEAAYQHTDRKRIKSDRSELKDNSERCNKKN
jgi:hypothetical protein